MRRTFVSLTVLAAAMALAAPRRADGGGSSAVEQKVAQMDKDWGDGMMRNDASVVERMEADGYAALFDGMPADKKSDLADAKSGAYAGTAELTGLKVRVFGDAAVVVGKATLRNATYKGKDISGDYLFTDMWVKLKGRWQVVASQADKAPAM